VFIGIVLSFHIIAVTLFGGVIVATNLRRLGIGMPSYSLEEVLKGLRNLKRISFLVAAVCGLLLFATAAPLYSGNRWFWIKIALIALAIVCEKSHGRVKLTAVLSLSLWTAAASAGRGPATIKDIMHSMVDPTGDAVFASVQEISDARGIREKAPHTDADWAEVRRHLEVLENVPALITAPGRRAAHPVDRSRNPGVEEQPESVQHLLDTDRSALLRRARRLHDAAALAMKAVDAKDKDALLRAIDGIDKACENCHLHYWYPNDKRARQAAIEDHIVDE
jgi:hypothetical protein